MILDKTRRKIYFNKTTAILWVILGVVSFFVGWKDAVWFVVAASVYANVKADWSTAEAADDRELKELLRQLLEAVENGNHHRDSCDRCSGVLRSGDDAGSDAV